MANTELTGPWADFAGHEELVVAYDEASGMQAVIAVHSTVLGPALGGVRMSCYADRPESGDQPRRTEAARHDALRLSRAMTYKNALAGLDHGGGKGVIFGDPGNKSVEVLHAFGRLVASLNGRYITAGDVGMSVADMDTIGQTCRWTTGRSPESGGLGDSGILTAVGVWQAMRAAAGQVWGTCDLAGRRVGVVGAGKVGGRLIGHLIDEGASVYVVDPATATLAGVLEKYPQVQVLESTAGLLATDLDVLSPNAMGGFLTMELAEHLSVPLICGGANNQLAAPEVAGVLAGRGVLYAPDFVVNCGGVIQVAEELAGCDLERARAKVMQVFTTTEKVLARAQLTGCTPMAAAEALAEDRIAGRG
ncbi:MAG: valine dehydrogenase [Actinomycetota bacterium]|nr:valine dehydrogenase [Actinomycetota bacterium]